MTPRPPTIVDLAKSLGLSKTTVAAALSGTGRVSAVTRERVQAAARAAGYIANPAARSLRMRHGGALGLYVPSDIRDMEFYMGFAFGAVDAAGRHGYDLTLLTTVPTEANPWRAYRGVIVIDALRDDPMLQSLTDSDVPLVVAGELDEEARRHTTGVIAIEHAEESYRALDALASLSSHHPAMIGAELRDETSWTSQVLAGYLRWAADHRVAPVHQTLPPFATNEELQHAVDAVLSDPSVDAILFGWQDAAERARLILSQPQYASRSLRIGAYASRPNAKALSTFDVTLNLEPHGFGFASVELLLATDSGDQQPVMARYDPTLSTAAEPSPVMRIPAG
ncbi:LacI family DNA-binding transcriptional regulator [Ruicaihuangia caeni]|uniref:LacI family DNA-binding transcriptional regulator n=1 Tax=Ruicaihuangia caeni TaxID=3042517 RepID=A0AAW6T411_9MICO|nr:LacI family DNA-binding transcriptional regulator [Klugiella sp. YN-L-19]MDI2098437.1 LacI family DNA-binding transcriptional regulator [Klugiella sp. YN-L-19]